MSAESDIISSILTGLGWDESLAVPIANEENKKLLHLIDLKQKQTSNNKNELNRINEKLTAMTNHLKNCRQELQNSLSLRNAKVEQNNSEIHMHKVIDRETGRLRQEIKRLDNKMKEMRQTKNIFENNLFSKTTELDNVKAQMKWDQQALEAWLDESQKKDEDMASIEKYARQDEARIKELNLQLEQLTAVRGKRRAKLDREVVETKTNQVELEKTGEEWRRVQSERENLITQWETTISELKRRDDEIDELANKLALVRLEADKMRDTMQARQRFHDDLVAANREADKALDTVERQAAKMRLEQRDLESQRLNFQSELDALRRTCDRTAADLELARVTISQLKKEKTEKETRKTQAMEKRLALEERLKQVVDDKLTAEQKANLADQLLEEEERSHLKLEQALKVARDMQFKKAQELHDAETLLRNITAEITGNCTAIRNMNFHIHKLDHSLLKQQEILYNQDFSIQQLERRINKMQGDHSNEEKDALELKVKQLTADLEAIVKVVATLTSQTKRVQDDIRRCKYDMDKINAENAKVVEKLEEVHLQNETSQQQLKRDRSEKEKLMVDDNIMKLEVKRLRDRLYSKAELVLDLDKRRLQLEEAVRERFDEIKIHKDMLQLQTRSAVEEKSKINSDLKARMSKIDKLEKRFDILTMSMAPAEGEQHQSQAYYVIKAAQQKEALQRQGDELDMKIRKAEKEIRALENTLVVMNTCNQNYRQSLSRVTDTSSEQGVKADLEVQLRTVLDKCHFKRRQLEQLEDDYQMLKETMDNLNRDEVLYGDQVKGLMDQLAQKEKEREKHREKIERAENTIIRLRNEILESQLSTEFDFVENDIKARDRKEFNRIAVNELIRCMQNHYPDLVVMTKQYLDMASLMPSSTPASSVRSSGGPPSRSSGSKPSSIALSSRSSSATLSINSTVSRKSSASPAVSVVQMQFTEGRSGSGADSHRRSTSSNKVSASSASSSAKSTARSNKRSTAGSRASRNS